MSDRELLERYVHIAEFFSLCISDTIEIVVHDVCDLQSSIVAIFNNISGRIIGDPMTDFGYRAIRDKTYLTESWVTNYRSMSENLENKVILRSSTYFIKNDSDALIGTMCINVNVDDFLKISDKLLAFANFGLSHPKNTTEKFELLSASVGNMISTTIADYCKKISIQPQKLKPQHKKDLIKALNDKGVFLIKGAITETAFELNISEPTVYRYISELKKTVSLTEENE